MTKDEFDTNQDSLDYLWEKLAAAPPGDGEYVRDYASVHLAAKSEYLEFAGDEIENGSFLDELLFAAALASERIAFDSVAHHLGVDAAKLREEVWRRMEDANAHEV